MPSPNWGGRRPGAGRKRSWLMLQPPAEVLRDIEQIATEDGCTVEDVVKNAIMSYILAWKADHKGADESASTDQD